VRLFDDAPPISYEGVKKLIEASFCARDHEFTADRAHQDGGVFDLKAAVGDGDLAKFLACGSDLTRMTLEAQSQEAGDRLSVSRVQASISPTDPDYDRILSLAKEGFHVPRDPTFQPVSDPPGLRNLYVKVSAAVNRQLVKEWHDNQCFILPTEITRKVEERHYAPIHWVPKPVEDGEISLGRKLVDHSDLSSGHSLNAGTSKDQAEEMYGELRHPTIVTFVRMFLRVVDKYGWDNTALYKVDLRNAFGLLRVKPAHARFLMSQMTDGYTAVAHDGTFGMSAMPATFGVASRVIARGVNKVISGEADTYADDTAGAGCLTEIKADMENSMKFCRDLFGSTAVNEKKCSFATDMDIIGWNVNMKTRMVTITERNFLKLLHGFCAVDTSKSVNVRFMRKLSGRSTRYSMLFRPFKALNSALYRSHGSLTGRNTFVPLQEDARIAIEIWRASIVLLGLDRSRFSKTMISFLPQAPTVTVQFDASLKGIGFLLTNDVSGGLLGGGRASFPFDLEGDSSHQNTCEFIAVVMALVAVVRSGRTGISIRLIGDSTVALKWSKKESWSGELSMKAAVVFLLFSVAFDIHVEEAEHILGVDNEACDDMSRDKSPEFVGVPINRIIEVEGHGVSQSLLRLCDPRALVTSGDSFVSLWGEVQRCIKEIRSELDTSEGRVLRSDAGVLSELAAAPFSPSLEL
jgi:hypothetical protein